MDIEDRERMVRVEEAVIAIRASLPEMAKAIDCQAIAHEKLKTEYDRDRGWVFTLVGGAWAAIIAFVVKKGM